MKYLVFSLLSLALSGCATFQVNYKYTCLVSPEGGLAKKYPTISIDVYVTDRRTAEEGVKQALSEMGLKYKQVKCQ